MLYTMLTKKSVRCPQPLFAPAMSTVVSKGYQGCTEGVLERGIHVYDTAGAVGQRFGVQRAAPGSYRSPMRNSMRRLTVGGLGMLRSALPSLCYSICMRLRPRCIWRRRTRERRLFDAGPNTCSIIFIAEKC
jgi:hypothetical protein